MAEHKEDSQSDGIPEGIFTIAFWIRSDLKFNATLNISTLDLSEIKSNFARESILDPEDVDFIILVSNGVAEQDIECTNDANFFKVVKTAIKNLSKNNAVVTLDCFWSTIIKIYPFGNGISSVSGKTIINSVAYNSNKPWELFEEKVRLKCGIADFGLFTYDKPVKKVS